MKIYLDFDGTVVEHEYPKIGRCNFGCFEVIKKLQDAGHEIVLNTYRADCADGTLEQALKLINENHWMLIKDRMCNIGFEIKPIGATSCKIFPAIWNIDQAITYGIIFIDDMAPNMPLKNAVMTNGKMVDWDVLDKIFEEKGIYERKV